MNEVLAETKREKDIAACAVMEFVNIMIGARESGFVDTSTPTLADVHKAARDHIKYRYGIEAPSIEDTWGEYVEYLCAGGVSGNRQ